MKRTILILLGIVMTITLFTGICTTAFAAGEMQTGSCGDSATYTMKDGIVTITGTGTIKENAFNENRSITEVYIGEGITEIGAMAFYRCFNLKYVSIPSSVEQIDIRAFSYIMNTPVDVEFKGSCPKIADGAFWASTLYFHVNDSWDDSTMRNYSNDATYYIGGWRTVGDGVKYSFDAVDSVIFRGTGTIKDGFLKNNQDIKKATIQEGITDIGESAFEDCTNLKEVSFPSTLTTICDRAFAGTGLTAVSVPSSVTSFGIRVFRNCHSLTSVTLSDGLTALGESMFSNCEKITSARLPNGITEIPNEAFLDCRALSSVTIPDTVQRISGEAFCNCSSLKAVDIPESVKLIGENAFYRCSSLSSLTFHDGIESLGKGCFEQCTLLKTVSLPETIVNLGDGTFGGCTALTSINIPQKITKIPSGTFGSCRALKNITIPDGVTSIGNSAFSECDALTEITLPASVTYIGRTLFHHCDNLAKVTCLAETVPSDGWEAFSNCSSLKNIYVPAFSTGLYAKADFWNKINIVGVFSGETLTPDANGVYHIKSEKDLAVLLHSISEGNTFSGKTIALDNDIDFASINLSSVWPDSKQENAFKGSFYGNDHTISNITVKQNAHRVALFRTADEGARIENLVLDNVIIDGSNRDCCAALIGYVKGTVAVSSVTVESGSISGGNYVGGIIGRSRGSKSLTITSCVNNASVTAAGSDAGGILGYSNTSAGATIEKCENTGAVASKSGHTGGIAGYLGDNSDDPDYTVQNCRNSGEITSQGNAGGILGGVRSDGIGHIIFQNENTANVSATGSGSYAGGIIGYLEGGGFVAYNKNSGAIFSTGREAGGIVAAIEDDSTEFDSDENSGDVSGKLRAGGIVGYAGDNDLDKAFQFTNCKNSGAVTSETSDAGGIVGGLCTDNRSHAVAGNSNSGEITGVKSVGGIIGWMEGGGNFLDNTNTGNVTSSGEDGKAGGTVGQIEDDPCKFDNCTSSGVIRGKKSASVCGWDGYSDRSIGDSGSLISSIFSGGSMYIIIGCTCLILSFGAIMLIVRKRSRNNPSK